MNKVKRFFWLCSGSYVRILEEIPSESSKYAGIGATILFTGLFAAIAASYAIFTFTDNYWISISIGLVWGLMIFNLDRYIVSSMRKSKSKKKEWIMATPRIVLALLISLVIARPLELKIFEKEVETALVAINKEIFRARQDSIHTYYDELIQKEEQAITRLQLPLLALESKRDSLRAEAAAEADGTGGTMRRNAGPIYRIKKANAERVELELETLRTTNDQLIAEKRANQSTFARARDSLLTSLPQPDYSGFAARLQAFGRLTSGSTSLWLANLFIILLFIAIETAPVLVKLISPIGPYDYRLAEIEYDHELSWIKTKARKNAQLRKATKGSSQPEQEYVDQYLSSGLN